MGFGVRVEGVRSRVEGRPVAIRRRLGQEHPRTLLPARDLLHGFRLQVSVFGFRFSGFGVRVSGFGFQAPDSGFRASGFGKEHPRTLLPARDLLRVSFRAQSLGSTFGFRLSGFESGFRVSRSEYRIHTVDFKTLLKSRSASGGSSRLGKEHPRTLLPARDLLHGFRFRDSGAGFQVSGFGFRVSGFRLRVPSFRFSDFGFRVSGFELRVPSFRFRASVFPTEVTP